VHSHCSCIPSCVRDNIVIQFRVRETLLRGSKRTTTRFPGTDTLLLNGFVYVCAREADLPLAKRIAHSAGCSQLLVNPNEVSGTRSSSNFDASFF